MKKILIFLCFVTISIQAQWVQISTVPTTQLNAVKFFDATTGIAVGANGIWRSTNSGINWVQTLVNVSMNGLCFYDSNSGYAVGDSGKIYRTINNGQNWIQQATGLVTNNLYGIAFSLSTTWHVVGSYSIILRTSNTLTWDYITWGNEDYYSVIMNSSGSGFAIGGVNHEVALATANGGTNWLTVLYQNSNNCFDGTFLNSASNILLVGNNGRIRKSLDYGSHWTFPQSNASSNLRAVTFPIANTGYIAGDNCTIRKSTDNGETWIVQTTGSNTENLKDISFINAETGWAVGQSGVVLRIGLPVGIENINSTVPNHFQLFQNYPNPFNPTTSIHFDIPSTNKSSIKIYNLEGQEVVSIFTGVLNRGSYKIVFDGTNVPSGVYCCSIKYGESIQSLKIVLIK